jgi:3'-5' exoribonuclease
MQGDTKLVMWDVTDQHAKGVPHKGDILLVDLNHKDVRDQRSSEYANIKVVPEALTFIKQEQLSQEQRDKLYQVAKASKEQLDQAYKTIADKTLYKDVNNFAFVMACLAAVPKDKLFTISAGKSIHHTYHGGLICHSAEVLNICRGVVEHFPFPQFINQDVVYAGASLHDIGKVFSYSFDEIGQPIHLPSESYLGHLFYGTSHVQKVGLERNVNPKFLEEVLHVIASHHSNPMFGAIKEPSTLEAIIVSQADYLGSRAGMLEAKLTPMKKNNTKLDEEWKAFDQRFMMGQAVRSWYQGEKT